MAAMEELGTLLQSLQTLKAPGVTKTKIDAVTTLCIQNVQSEPAIVQMIVQQFKNNPVTHKLGVVYVLDSVTRQWVDKAKVSGQAVSKNAAPGTFASGVQHMTEVLPGLMTDLIQSAPDNQKDKISKLLDIWERGQTFPLSMLATIKQQLKNPQNNLHTPTATPPNGFASTGFFGHQTNSLPVPVAHVAPPAQAQAPAPAAVQPDTNALLTALAGFTQPSAHPAPPTNPVPSMPPAYAFPQAGLAPPPPLGFMPPLPTAASVQAVPPPPIAGNDIMVQVLQAIQSGLIPPQQAVQVIAALASQTGGAPVVPPPQPSVIAAPQPAVQTGNKLDRFEANGSRYRDRSRSPDFRPRQASPQRRTPPNRRDSPTYGVYDPNAGAEGNAAGPNGRERARGRGRNRGRNEYRQRTPPGQRRQAPSPGPSPSASRNQPRLIEWDDSLRPNNIKVLSRTLFVGGANGTEGEIKDIFSRFGKVQTCIVNSERRHAFVKMVHRKDAVAAKEGMDNMQDQLALSKARQTRWGVGFGPRDCSDYNLGISVIPISRLTEADRKWVVTAEYGGTGGRPLEPGMVLEEPDIEIGAGVSSKAISNRVNVRPEPGTGRRGGGGHGGHNNGPRGGQEKFRKQERAPPNEPRRVSPRPEPTVAVPPAVPGFGFQLPGMSRY